MTVNYLTILCCFLLVGLSTQNNPSPQGNYPPPGYAAPQGYPQQQQYQQPQQYAPSNEDPQQQQMRYQQYQQRMQQQQQQQQQQGQQRGPYGAPYQSRYSPQDYDSYGRGSQFQPTESLFSKFKNTVFSVGSTIANTLTSSVGSDSPTDGMFSPQQAASSGFSRRPETDEYGRPYPGPRSPYPPAQQEDQQQQQQQQQPGVLKSMFGRVKGWWNGHADESPASTAPFGSPLYQYQQQQQALQYGRRQTTPPPPPPSPYAASGYAAQAPRPGGSYYSSSPSTASNGGGAAAAAPSLDASFDPTAAVGATLAAGQAPVDFYPSQGSTWTQPPPPSAQLQQSTAPSATSAAASVAAAAPPVDPLSLISPEPQVIIHEDNVVMILNPLEFYRKKFAMHRAGFSALQVFSDFERVLTRAKNGEGKSAEPTLSSMDVIETAALSAESLARLKAIAESDYPEMDAAAFEEMTVKSQAVLVDSNAVNIGSIAPAVRSNLARMGLRPGWLPALTSLSLRGVPTFVFSSGYGDIVREALLQGGLTSAAATAGGAGTAQQQQQQQQLYPQLPQNVRIISNNFRFDPTGNVKAFSQPVVHERNKNVTTAAAHMGMPVPNRPFALVIGSHEDDVKMTEGLSGLKEQLSIGYMEVGSDLTERLPAYLKSFDAVVVGDSSMAFVSSLVDELLGLPKKTSSLAGSGDHGGAGVGGLLNFKRFGGFLNTVTSVGGGSAAAGAGQTSTAGAASGAAPSSKDYFMH